jgi:type 1 glutamine amidotransferase
MSQISRRNVLKTGFTTLASAAIMTPEGFSATPQEIRPKRPGEKKAIFLGGDQLHNFMAQEPALRSICERQGYKFYSLHDSRYLTPSFISDADVLMIERWDGGVAGTVSGPVYVEAPSPDDFITEALADAIIENVTKRGMGFLSIHCMIASAFEREKLMDFLGVKGIIHGPLQPVHVHSFNPIHPITKGIKPFDLPLDENFGAEIYRSDVTPLFETTGFWDKRNDFGGWCLEKGKGRVAGLTAGHTYFAFRDRNYLNLFWRSIQWVTKNEVTDYSQNVRG